MNAQWLYRADGTRTEYSICGECGQLARGESNWDLSEKCCTCLECGLIINKSDRSFSRYHAACESIRDAREEARRLEHAALIEYDGPIYCEHADFGNYGDGYFSDMEDLLERLDSRAGDRPRPEFAYVCASRPALQLDLTEIIDSALEESFEGAIDHMRGVSDLQAAVDWFNTRNVDVLTYEADFMRKVIVPGERE